jgi:hypothetical protein
MSEQPPPIERHAAADRFGKRALRTAHDITAALAEHAGGAEEEPVLLHRNGPHRSIGTLEALIDAALEDDEPPPELPPAGGRKLPPGAR